jgi:hypothetical protein
MGKPQDGDKRRAQTQSWSNLRALIFEYVNPYHREENGRLQLKIPDRPANKGTIRDQDCSDRGKRLNENPKRKT